jgi:hypothetical protein
MQRLTDEWVWCSRCGTLKDQRETHVPSAVSRLPANRDAFSAIEVMIACSLYWFNVNRYTIAKKLYDHFEGHCYEIDELIEYLDKHGGDIATALPLPTAVVYVSHALGQYGEEAKERVYGEFGLYPGQA